MENHTVYEKAALKVVGIVIIGMMLDRKPGEMMEEAATILEKEFIPKPE